MSCAASHLWAPWSLLSVDHSHFALDILVFDAELSPDENHGADAASAAGKCVYERAESRWCLSCCLLHLPPLCSSFYTRALHTAPTLRDRASPATPTFRGHVEGIPRARQSTLAAAADWDEHHADVAAYLSMWRSASGIHNESHPSLPLSSSILLS